MYAQLKFNATLSYSCQCTKECARVTPCLLSPVLLEEPCVCVCVPHSPLWGGLLSFGSLRGLRSIFAAPGTEFWSSWDLLDPLAQFHIVSSYSLSPWYS